jgi:hypothetical protein
MAISKSLPPTVPCFEHSSMNRTEAPRFGSWPIFAKWESGSHHKKVVCLDVPRALARRRLYVVVTSIAGEWPDTDPVTRLPGVHRAAD